MRQIAHVARIRGRLGLALQCPHKSVHRRRPVEEALRELRAKLWPAGSPAEHQIEQLASAGEKSAVVARPTRVDAQVLEHRVGPERENELGTPTLVAARLERRRAQQLNRLGEIVKAGKRLAQISHVLVAEFGRILGKQGAPFAPLLVIGDGPLTDGLDEWVVEQQAAKPNLVLRALSHLVAGRGDQWAVQI